MARRIWYLLVASIIVIFRYEVLFFLQVNDATCLDIWPLGTYPRTYICKNWATKNFLKQPEVAESNSSLKQPEADEADQGYESSLTKLKEIKTDGSCLVLYTFSFDKFSSLVGNETLPVAYGLNYMWAFKHGCNFLAVAQQENSCSHWRYGIHHHSWCLLQEINHIIEHSVGSKLSWILATNHDQVIPEKLNIAKINDYVSNSTEHIWVFRDTKIQLWRNSHFNRKLTCTLWQTIWNKKNMGDMQTKIVSTFTNQTHKFSGIRNIVNDFHPNIRIIDDSIAAAKSASKSDLLSKCLKILIKSYEHFEKLTQRDLSFDVKHCFLKVTYHYARDKCVAEAQYEYPKHVVPELDCKIDKEQIRMAQPKSAIVLYFTEIGGEEKFEAALRRVLVYVPQIARANANVDIVFATGPLNKWNIERSQKFSEMFENITKKVGPRVKHLIPETIKKEDIKCELLRQYLEESWNCCGWSEYQKLGAWNLDMYDSVIVTDMDVNFFDWKNSEKSNIFDCWSSFDFLSSPDPQVALQGGFFYLKPSHRVYLEMKKVLGAQNIYDPYSGWGNSGPSFSINHASKSRRAKGKKTQSFAHETNQGFLFYFFHIYLPRRNKLSGQLGDSWSHVKTGELEINYNYRETSWRSVNDGDVGFNLYRTAHHYLKEKTNSIPLHSCHGCKDGITFIPTGFLDPEKSKRKRDMIRKA